MRNRLTGFKQGILLSACLGLAPASLLAASSDWVYAVLQGDTLSEFGKQYLRKDIDWRQVQKLNQIRNPDVIRPGQKIRVPSSWLNAQPSAAEVVAMTGDVRVQRKDSNGSAALKMNDRLVLGDRLSTGDDSSITIRFADTSELTLLQNSELIFDQLSLFGDSGMVDSKLRLSQGSAEARVKPRMDARARFEIHTPSAISAVRGTEFRSVYQEGSAAARVEVLTGGVAVAAEGVSQLVPAGFGTRVKQGEAPVQPKELLPPAEFMPVANEIIQRNYNLQWQPLQGAQAYRVQISDTPRFSTLKTDEIIQQPGFFLPQFNNGDYYLRVRGIDNLDIEGRGSVAQLPLRVQPLPPLMVYYPWQQAVVGNYYQFSWSAPEKAIRWHFQVARDADFSEIVSDQQDLGQSLSQKVFLDQPGDYFWRVASVDENGNKGVFSPAATLNVQSKHRILQGDWLADRQTVRIQIPGLSHDRYKVQLAADTEFQQILEEWNRGPGELELDRFMSVRYIRIASVKGEQHGQWGESQMIAPDIHNDTAALISWLSGAAFLL
ncbi:FecR domain-containing protein [Oceanospirillum sediminis]|uniref:FecR domain-containing protein n=1 Tax=Oceanospirillum sediminis TaxID=2760088 RepID=A0A839ISR6_9GAMM|nr:FecR domain-containing protein [Oceanospirillum sediminis]MBB1487216.1 FecR domain-containing protein [Oceanospirillum sediminis]